MRVTRKVMCFCLLAVMSVAVQTASAVLPHSTFGDDGTEVWGGSKTYQKDGLDVLVLFNVYDTLLYSNEFAWAGKPAGDRYIYAYQIANHPSRSTDDIGSFSLLNLAGNPILETLMHGTTALDDTGNGISPDPLPTEEQGAWMWSSTGGYIDPGEHSWYLVFSSNNAPTKGNFKVLTSSEIETEPPIPEVPEPAMTALVGLGGMMLLSRKPLRSRRGRAG